MASLKIGNTDLAKEVNNSMNYDWLDNDEILEKLDEIDTALYEYSLEMSGKELADLDDFEFQDLQDILDDFAILINNADHQGYTEEVYDKIRSLEGQLQDLYKQFGI